VNPDLAIHFEEIRESGFDHDVVAAGNVESAAL
jgi:hypothetical protein